MQKNKTLKKTLKGHPPEPRFEAQKLLALQLCIRSDAEKQLADAMEAEPEVWSENFVHCGAESRKKNVQNGSSHPIPKTQLKHLPAVSPMWHQYPVHCSTIPALKSAVLLQVCSSTLGLDLHIVGSIWAKKKHGRLEQDVFRVPIKDGSNAWHQFGQASWPSMLKEALELSSRPPQSSSFFGLALWYLKWHQKISGPKWTTRRFRWATPCCAIWSPFCRTSPTPWASSSAAPRWTRRAQRCPGSC